MNGAQILLETLKAHGVEVVFGLPGETTLPLYREWKNCREIRHILARDERSAAYMADAYARTAFKPGVCEGPSPGATHLLPGVAEAYKASVAMVVLTSDVPLQYDTRNVLTSLDQTALFRGVTKESLTTRTAEEMPTILRRAFRLATTQRPGPVHVRLPMDVLEADAGPVSVEARSAYSRYPSHRSVPTNETLTVAVRLLLESKRPVLVCGQGVLYSQCWDEVRELAEPLNLPVATTITGKGSFAETHPLSVGVIGSRGGTSFSNRVLAEADLVFYIGSDTDSVTTVNWTLPSPWGETVILHLDISEQEAGNTYPKALTLVGDAKATLQAMIPLVRDAVTEEVKERNSSRVAVLQRERMMFTEQILKKATDGAEIVDPIAFVQALQETLPESHIILTDPGVSAIYLSAFYRPPKPGRTLVFNYAMGALGYALPAAVGAHFARPNHCVVALTGDGSFGFCAAELETIARIGGNINVVLFNNGCYGWIRAAARFTYNSEPFATEFDSPDYVRLAEAFGIEAVRVAKTHDLKTVLERAFSTDRPTFVELKVESEDERVPPVPGWVEPAKERGLPSVY
jgi:acetolactate synthase-1/2/3 large subunit